MRQAAGAARIMTALAVCVFPASTLAAETQLLVVPVGYDEAFEPTARVAAAIVRQLNRDGQARSRFYFPLPPEQTAPPPVGQAKARLDKAVEAFQMLEFGEARKQVDQAIAGYKVQIEGGGPSDGYVEALHLRAAVELFDSHEKAAARAMRDAIVFSSQPPSTERYNPTVQQLHEHLSNTKEPRGTLRIDAVPGALIWFNGRLRGLVTKHDIEVAPGLHWVRVSRPGYAPWLEWVRVAPGKADKISVPLEKLPADESPLIAQLRDAVRSPGPGEGAQQALRDGRGDELLVVSAGIECDQTHCPIAMHWARGDGWARQSKGVLVGGNAAALAAHLLGRGAAELGSGGVPGSSEGYAAVTPCASDSECSSLHHKCVDNVCREVVPLIRKWWFWTLIGVAAAGAAAAITVPLLMPDTPVIEVK